MAYADDLAIVEVIAKTKILLEIMSTIPINMVKQKFEKMRIKSA